jgi:TolB protein
VDTAGSAKHQILGGDWQFPDWSPDGTRLAISLGNVIYSVKRTGDDLQAITSAGYRPRWSPTGNELAFQSFDTTGTGRVGIVSREGTGLRWLTPSGIESWLEPDWSPDGTRLVHRRYFPYWPDSSSRDDIYVVDSTGHAEQRLTQDGGVNAEPAWSPDGQWIAWSKSGTIWLMKSDGTEARALIYGDGPSWSPDSRRIAFSQLTFNVVRLYAIDPATLRIRQITQ